MYKSILPYLSIVLLLLSLVQCSPDQNFEVEGKFTVADPTPVRMYQLTHTDALLVDSTHTTEGAFKLAGSIEYPGIYLLKFFNNQRIFLIVHPGDAIELQIDNTHELISYYVKNSVDSKLVKELTDKQNNVLRTIDQLSQAWTQTGTDSTLRRTIDSTYHATLRQHRADTRTFIKEHPGSLANIMAVYQNVGRKSQSLFDPYDDHDLFCFVDSNLILRYPNTAAVQALSQEVNDIRAQIAQKKLIEKVVEEGRPLPPFAYPDTDGDTIHLNTNRQKPAVLLFWASWNRYSVQQLHELNSLANQLKRQNIDIVSISLDTREEVLDTFMIQQNIQIPVVCDYNYWDSEIPARYAIKRIPSTLLVNREGVIIGKDIFGPELTQRIKLLIR